jgi:hypothetical protein
MAPGCRLKPCQAGARRLYLPPEPAKDTEDRFSMDPHPLQVERIIPAKTLTVATNFRFANKAPAGITPR